MIGLRDKVLKIIEYFKDKPVIKTELVYKNEYELLIAVVVE